MNEFILLIDPEDEAVVSRHKWYEDGMGHLWTSIRGRPVYLRYLICPLKFSSLMLRYKNNNYYDNRKSNLEVVTRSGKKVKDAVNTTIN